MTDLLEQGAQWLNDQQREHTSRMVLYQRGEDSVEVPATIGRTVHEVENTYGVIEKVETRDFIIRAQDLLLNGNPITPQRGDRVIESIGGELPSTLTYEVMSPGTSTGSSHYRFADPYRLAFRIHTKHVATGAPEAPGEPQ